MLKVQFPLNQDMAVFLFVKIALRIRRQGGTMTTVVHGSLDSFYNKEQKKAVEMVVEKQAKKKLDEQTSGEDQNE